MRSVPSQCPSKKHFCPPLCCTCNRRSRFPRCSRSSRPSRSQPPTRVWTVPFQTCAQRASPAATRSTAARARRASRAQWAPYAETHAPGPPHCAYGEHVSASCVQYVPEAQGGLPLWAPRTKCVYNQPRANRGTPYDRRARTRALSTSSAAMILPARCRCRGACRTCARRGASGLCSAQRVSTAPTSRARSSVPRATL